MSLRALSMGASARGMLMPWRSSSLGVGPMATGISSKLAAAAMPPRLLALLLMRELILLGRSVPIVASGSLAVDSMERLVGLLCSFLAD